MLRSKEPSSRCDTAAVSSHDRPINAFEALYGALLRPSCQRVLRPKSEAIVGQPTIARHQGSQPKEGGSSVTLREKALHMTPGIGS